MPDHVSNPRVEAAIRARDLAFVCVLLPRFELTVAVGGPEALASRPLAIAPTSGAQRVGEVSGTAQATGVVTGMRLGEALARCPQLALVPEDPIGVTRAWELTARALESIGAEVELARPGLAYFDAGALRSLYRDAPSMIAAVRDALKRPSRIGGGPTRFVSLAAALEAARVLRADLREVAEVYERAATDSLIAYPERPDGQRPELTGDGRAPRRLRPVAEPQAQSVAAVRSL